MRYQLQKSVSNTAERQRALFFLVDFWISHPDVVQNPSNDGKLTTAIMQALKKTSKERSRALSTISLNLMSSLLDVFSKERNNFAPIIYKMMTFILIESFHNVDLREEMLNIFTNLYQNNPTIPI